MKIGELTQDQLKAQLMGEGLPVTLGPFATRIRSGFRSMVPLLHQLYEEHPISSSEFVDFDVQVQPSRGLRWGRSQACFLADGRMPFWPLPAEQAMPALEWGINWCVAMRSNHLLMLHSAVVERNGNAILFPAWSGHGKSTLCTALIHSGWRLLSDEFGLVRPDDGALIPVPRLIPLKNESIEVIRRFRPDAVIGPSFHGTRKGTVAHVRPPAESVRRADETARAHLIVFPRWVAGAPLAIEPVAKGEAFLMVATNAFNYEILGEAAFEVVRRMVRDCGAYALTYSDLDEAISALNALAELPDAQR